MLDHTKRKEQQYTTMRASHIILSGAPADRHLIVEQLREVLGIELTLYPDEVLGAPHFSAAVGIDVSDAMLDEARARVPRARIINADVMRNPPDVGTFQVISLFRFILSAELELREGVLRWLRSVIAPNGVLVVNNHLNGRSVTGLVYRIEHRWHGHQGRPPIDDEIEALMRRCGFAVRERFGFGIIPPWRDRRLMPSAALLQMERRLGYSQTLQRYAKDRIFVCAPI